VLVYLAVFQRQQVHMRKGNQPAEDEH